MRARRFDPRVAGSRSRAGSVVFRHLTLRVGTRIGHFEVTGLLGVGGMGQVYRATDTKLRRDVALKILPEQFATDPERLSRFEREAHALAALNHSGIAAIHGIEEFEGTLALVLELVSGPTLEDRIARRPIPVAEALRLAIGIAAAVEAAHDRGIIHRDLKPANIKIRDDGAVKVLDFGLAKALSSAGGQAQVLASEDPTQAATAPGLILGTAAYMSPEQARGEPVDERTDVWAFGCILFEMLTGEPPFGRARLTDILANVLKGEPDYSALPGDTPPLTRRLVRRCLEKDRRQRLRHIGDARADLSDSLELRDAASGSTSGAASAVESAKRQRTTQRRALVAGALVATAAVAGLAGWLIAPRLAPATSKSAVVSFEIGDVSLSSVFPPSFAVSPDGTRIVYPSPRGFIQRSLRHADQVQARWEPHAIEYPFFSPDGEWIGAFTTPRNTTLTRVSVRGGAPTVIADIGVDAWVHGGSWGSDDRIVFATTLGLHRVAAGGGKPELFVTPDPDQQELHFWAPEILPGGGTVLFTVIPRDPKAAPRVVALDLVSLERKTVLTEGAAARYAPTGHLVYVVRGRLQAVAFDAKALETRGDPQTVLDGEVLGSNFELSDKGTLVYHPAVPAEGAEVLVWVDRDGRQEQITAPAGSWIYPRISPDGKRVASDRWLKEGRDIYIWDLERQSLSRLTDDPSQDVFPHWSADGSRLFFSSNRSGAAFDLYSRAADGTGSDELVFESDLEKMLGGGLTPDGAQLVVMQSGSGGRFDIAAVDVEEPRLVRVLLATKASESSPSVSPDGRWVAYTSDDEGLVEVFVAPFPEMDQRRWQISSGGGDTPLWSAKGDEIFFRGPSGSMMAAQVTLTPTFAHGTGTELFSNPSNGDYQLGCCGRSYDVSPIGRRFLMAKAPDRSRDRRLVVVTNWFEELQAKVPVG